MVAVLIMQAGFEESAAELIGEVFLSSVCNVTGTMVNICCGIEKHLL
ncbi:hypothetical protein [Calidifontibacillus oryziterrae]|nr:hypothetical protein [Calidifontibacillus oryziterrae]